jgi:hypothetical protein
MNRFANFVFGTHQGVSLVDAIVGAFGLAASGRLARVHAGFECILCHGIDIAQFVL